MGALYFQNQFLGKPTMAGKGDLNLNMGIENNGIPFQKSFRANVDLRL
jgi:hypothetical protein